MPDIFNIQIGDVVFEDWTVTRRIGNGASGIVYEVKKKDEFIENTSVIKVIYIPQDESVKNQLLLEGMDDSDATSYIRNIVNTLVDEIKIMISLKEFPYIVRCEDHKLIKSTDESRWCILIRMEKLTPFQEWQREHSITEKDIHSLAVDMAKTLALFEANGGIIHRDIKPQNIFVSPFGDFKLGDFGIARICDATVTSLSRKGTEEYMAPEVYLGEFYDNTVDIYSLGLVLYQTLNRNRLPFVPLDATYTAMDRHQAFIKRIKGKEAMNPPADASPEFSSIIMKMCQHNPGNRYQSSVELLSDLETVTPSSQPLFRNRHASTSAGNTQDQLDALSLTNEIFSSRSKRKTAQTADGKLAEIIDRYPDKSRPETKQPEKEKPEKQNPENVKAPKPETEDKISEPERDVLPAEKALTPVKDNRSAAKTQTIEKNVRTVQKEIVSHPEPEEEETEEKGKRSWKKSILLAASFIVICLGVLVPYIINMEFALNVNGGTGTGSYKTGDIVTVSASGKEGTHFAGWKAEGINLQEEDVSSPELTFRMPRRKVSLTAIYEDNTYTLTVKGAEGSGDYLAGDEIILTADDIGTFIGWSIDEGNVQFDEEEMSNPVLSFVMPSENIVITAKQVAFSLSVTGAEGSGEYHAGDEITLHSEDGDLFANWTIDSGTLDIAQEALEKEDLTFRMPAEDVSVTSHQKTFTLSVTGAEGSGEYYAGDSVSLHAEAEDFFSGWTIDSGSLDVEEEYLDNVDISFAMPPEDTSISAHPGTAEEYTDAGEQYYLNEKDYGSALILYEKAAELGGSYALFSIGYMYSVGEGVEQDYEKAYEYYSRAAELGESPAVNNLGVMYEEGDGVEQDYEKAVKYYTQATALGNPQSMCNLGWMYQNGYGVEQDYETAIDYYSKSAELGNAMAMARLGNMYDNGYGVTQDYSKAFEYYKQAADLGDSTAMFCIANMYEFGAGVEQNIKKALYYYKQAAELGNESAGQRVEELESSAKRKMILDYCHLREEPDPSGTILIDLHKDTVVDLLGENDGWAFIRVVDTDMEGYILSRFLEPEGGEETEEVLTTSTEPVSEASEKNSEPISKATVSQYCHLRDKPDRIGFVICDLHKGTAVDLLDEADGWAFIRVADTGMEGYILSRFLEPEDTEASEETEEVPTISTEPVSEAGVENGEPISKATVSQYCHLRDKPDRIGFVICDLHKGTAVDLLEKADVWSHIRVSETGMEGYILSRFLKSEDTEDVEERLTEETVVDIINNASVAFTPERVFEVQAILYTMGYDCWPIDGVAGDQTIGAMKAFQEDYGAEYPWVDESGAISAGFLKSLRSAMVSYEGEPDYSSLLKVLQKEKEEDDYLEWCLENLISPTSSISDITESMVAIGVCYEIGDGVPENDNRAFQWYLQAAARKEVQAMIYISDLYEDKWFDDEDIGGRELVLDWLLKGVSYGDSESCGRMAALYQFGLIVDEDHTAAIQWYQQAVAYGGAIYLVDIGDVYKKDGDYDTALEWYKKAEEAGYDVSYKMEDLKKIMENG